MIEDYFKEIDTSDKSYFLGMMFADGNIYKRKDRKETYRIQLKLKKEDKYLVEKFSDCIASHIKVRDEKDGSRLIFTNKAIALDLISQGCIPKKSLIKQFPRKIPKEFMNDFIRGYFDGNGCFSIRKNNRLVVRIYSGSMNFIYSLGKILTNEHINITNIYDETKRSGVYCLEIGKKSEVLKFLNFIYNQKNSIYLKRKFNIACQYRDNLISKNN